MTNRRSARRLAAALGALGALAAAVAAAQTEPRPGDPVVLEESGDRVGRQAPPGTEPVAVPEPSERALRYYRSGNRLWLAGLLWGFVVPAALLLSGASARLRSWAARLARGRWFVTVAIYAAALVAILFVADLPLSYYAGFVRPHAYELSNQSLAKWAADAAKGLGVSLVGAVAFLWLPYLLLARSPRRWWLYSGLAALPFFLFMALVAPIWISPLFNDFGPMRDAALEADILALAERAGIEGGRVFEVDKSVDTKTVNAYVTGFWNTKRIVLWDTILAKLERRQILFVMGHEMGHYVLQHVILSILFAFTVVLSGLWLIHRTSGRLLERLHRRFGFRELADVASMPLLMLLLGLFSFAVQPLGLAFSRQIEHEADRFGLELTRDNRAAAEAFVRLQQENLSNPRPGPLVKLFRWSHPPLGERIDFCNTYRPWETGAPLRYGHHLAR